MHAAVGGGSYSFTMAAVGRDAENVTFIASPDIARLYRQNCEARGAESRPTMPPQSLDADRAPFVAAR